MTPSWVLMENPLKWNILIENSRSVFYLLSDLRRDSSVENIDQNISVTALRSS